MKSSPGEITHAVAGVRTDTLTESVLLLLGMAILQRVVGFVREMFFCGWLEPKQLGEWNVAYGFFLIAAPIAVLGLPGSFGRYLEYYRQQGQLRAILRRTGIVCGVLALAAMTTVGLFGSWFSNLIFGRPDRTDVVLIMAAVLLAVIAYNFLTEMLTALRMFRIVSVLQFLNSSVFAILGIGLLIGWQKSVSSVVVAFGGACLLGGIIGITWLRKTWKSLPADTHPLEHRQLWDKLLPYAAWMWVGNLLFNLFETADRYMLVHCSRFNEDEALVAVGNYHSSRVVPLLLLTVATMLGGMITPHLSHDWEAGRRGAVSHRLNLTLKILGLGLFAASVAIMLAGPLLFGVILRGKYDGGLVVLPWTLAYCNWLGLAVVAQNYLWCAEKARLSSLAFLIGLLVNVGLNLVLVPQHGLLGAVWATAAAKLVAMSLIFLFSKKLGHTLDHSVWLIALLPVALGGGLWVALTALGGIVIAAFYRNLIFNTVERDEIKTAFGRYAAKWPLGKSRVPAGT